MMFGSYESASRRRVCLLQLVLALLSIVLLADSVVAQQNITLDDTDLYILYAPATSWHASTVECDTCLAPPSSSAHGGTWHDGTHIIPTSDEDDEGTVGDLDGDGSTSASYVAASTSAPVQPSSTASVQLAQTSAATNISGDGHGGKGGKGSDGNGRRRFRRLVRSVKLRQSGSGNLIEKRDNENPFEVQNNDDDDPGFQDVPVTATLNFTGQAVYVFAILPLFPAPPNTAPTFTNLSFTLDGAPHGSFAYRPDATIPGTPTANSSASDKFLPNMNVFSASGLDDTEHSLVVNVGVDSVLLLDYVMITVGASDPTTLGSITTSAPNNERTAGAVVNSATNKHNVATFAGAVGGSFGLLSALALGLCISIRCRRRRAHIRENRARRAAFAENFTARDHGEVGPDDEEDGAFRQRSTGPVMTQANPAPFVPRYFPGSLPASPPPYVPEGDRVVTTSPMSVSINRAGLPVAIPSTLPPIIALPTATLDLQRTASNNSSQSYADRPPPTPPDEDFRTSLFGLSGVRDERNLNGGIIGPLPLDTPSSEESDPMLGVEVDDGNGEEDRPPARRTSSESIGCHTFGTSRSSRNSGLSEPSGATPSLTFTRHSLPTSGAPSESEPLEMRPKQDGATTSNGFPTLSTATSLPSLSAPSSSRLLSSPSSPDLAPKPAFFGGLSSLAYPLLQPSRVPLPPSIYGADLGSQDTLERRDSRT